MQEDRKDRRTLHNVLALAVLVAIAVGVTCVAHSADPIFVAGAIASGVGVLVLAIIIVGVTSLLINNARIRRDVALAQQERRREASS